MKTIILLAIVSLGLSACGGSGGSDSSSPSSPAPTAATPPKGQTPPAASTPMPLCTDVARCAQKCADDNPFMTDQAIIRQCVIRWGYPSGPCTQLLNQSHLNYDNYNLCLAKPVDQVVAYP